jgi:hypothetical protein
METPKFEIIKDIFNEFSLSNDEMIYVRGGDGDPITIPTPPPIKV